MIKKLIEFIKKKGFHIGYSNGKEWDPYYQERTDAMDDIIKSIKKVKQKEKVDNGTNGKN
jgi:hypothetical protein